jgi:hypothetical protein
LKQWDLSAVIDWALTAFGSAAPSQLALNPAANCTFYLFPTCLRRVIEEALASHGCKNRTCGPPAAASCKPISQTTRAKQRTSIASHARLFDWRWNCFAGKAERHPIQKPAEVPQRPVSCTDLCGRTLGPLSRAPYLANAHPGEPDWRDVSSLQS